MIIHWSSQGLTTTEAWPAFVTRRTPALPITIAVVDNTNLLGTTTLGDVTTAFDMIFAVDNTSLLGTTTLGNETILLTFGASPTGVFATGAVGQVNVWASLDDAQTSSFGEIDDSQTPAWVEIDDSETDDWVEIVT